MCVEVCRTRHQAEQLAAQRACHALKLTASGELPCVNLCVLILGSSNWLMYMVCVCVNTGTAFSDASGDSRQGMLVLVVVCVNVYIRT